MIHKPLPNVCGSVDPEFLPLRLSHALAPYLDLVPDSDHVGAVSPLDEYDSLAVAAKSAASKAKSHDR